MTIADLIGDIDPIKAATLKLAFADEEVIHYGIIPRTNRGIFAINELPDLPPRIQVGLLNIMEEKDIQIRGFPVRMPLDILMVYSANPEDYTNRGNIITPLKDRIDSQILTHYPTRPSTAVAHHRAGGLDRATAGRHDRPSGDDVKLLIEEIAFVARKSEFVDQSSGVSRPDAHRRPRAARLEHGAARPADGEKVVAPRLVDLFATLPAITGKIEMVYEGEQQGAEIVAKKLIGDAVKGLFEAKFPPVEGPALARRSAPGGATEDEETFGPVARRTACPSGAPHPPPPAPTTRSSASFTKERKIVLSDDAPFAEHLKTLESVPGPLRLRPEAREATRPLRARLPDGARPRGARPEPPDRSRGPRLDRHVRRGREVQPDEEPGLVDLGEPERLRRGRPAFARL